DSTQWESHKHNSNCFPLFLKDDYLAARVVHHEANFVYLHYTEMDEEILLALKADKTAVVILYADSTHPVLTLRHTFIQFLKIGILNPIILEKEVMIPVENDEFLINSSIDTGSLYADGLGDGIFLSCDEDAPEHHQGRVYQHISVSNKT